MRKDPKEFRERFQRWKAGEQVYEDGLPKYQDGKEEGPTPAEAAMIKARIAIDSHFGNPAMRRIANYDGRSYTFPNEYDEVNPGIYEQRKGNVYVGSADEYIYPGIQDVNGKLEFIENPYDYPGEKIKFNNWKDAAVFGEKYKHFAPMMKLPRYEDGKPSYDDSTDFISKYEGWSDTAYQKKGDVPTIGYGTTNKKWVSKGRITRDQGRQAMMEDLAANEPMLRKNIRNYDRLPDTAKTVLRDILYNVGQGNMFKKSPKFMEALNAGNWEEAARQMDWDNNKPGFSGARKRNAARQQLFLQDLRNNPVHPQSEFVQQLSQQPAWQPKLDYIGTPTQYPLHNTVPQSISSWSGPDSPSAMNDIKLPSIYEMMNRLLIERKLMFPSINNKYAE